MTAVKMGAGLVQAAAVARVQLDRMVLEVL
jgi:hypothetical protein